MMIRNFLLLLLLFRLSAAAHAQDSIVIYGTFKHNSKYAIAVLEQFGLGSYPIAKTSIHSETGALRLALPAEIARGIYRLRYSMADAGSYVDIVVNGEKEIRFTLDLFDSLRAPRFEQSPENAAWYGYRLQMQRHGQKIGQLGELISNYPSGSEERVIQEARKRRAEEIAAVLRLRKDYVKRYADAISGRVEKQKSLFFPEPGQPYQLQAYNRWVSYWNDVDPADTALLNTPLYTELIIGYMMYWIDPGMGFTEKERTEGFIKSTDTLLHYFDKNTVMKRFVREYLTAGFKELGEEAVLQYIDEKYNAAAQCDEGNTELEKRLAAYKELAPGRPAPRIYVTNLAGVEQEFIRNVEQDTLILAFWAGWCPHCRETMPILDSVIAGRSNIKVLAISLDTAATEWINEKTRLAHMQHYCDFKKWDSRPVKDYHIVATPTFFLIDKDRFIAGKYLSVQALLEGIKQ